MPSSVRDRARELVIFAKEPVAGRAKTRLAGPRLSLEAAAACHAAFVEDTARRMAAAFGGPQGLATRLVLAVDPAGNAPVLESLAGRYGLSVVDQGAGDLGARMERVMAGAFDRGARCVLLGADTPDLPAAYVEAAFRGVAEGRVALGPSADGGYYLIGARCPAPDVFRLSSPWGGPGVFGETLRRLAEAGVARTILPRWNDVDEYADLLDLKRRLRASRVDAPATRALLERLLG